MRSGPVVLLLILLGGALAWALFLASDPGTTSGEAQANARRSESGQDTAALPPAAESRTAVAPAGAGTGGMSGDPPKTLRLRGTFSVTDKNGVVHDETSGRFVLFCWTGNGGTGVDVTVTHGAWSAAILRCEKLSVGSAKLDGRSVVCDAESIELPDPIPPNRSFAFRGKWLASNSLRVVDADTLADLRELTVVRVRDWRRDDFAHPGNHRDNIHVLDEVDSPVELPLPEGHTGEALPYWVSAPGYAWGRIRIEHAKKAARELRLRRGGALRILLVGGLSAKAVLRLRPPGKPGMRPPDITDEQWAAHEKRLAQTLGSPVAEALPPTNGPLLLRGLAEGRYQLQLERGESFQEPLVLGAAAVEIRAGETAQATIEVRDEAAPPLVPVAGILRIPATWKFTDVTLHFDPIGKVRSWVDSPKYLHRPSLKPTGTGKDLAFDAGRLRAGTYQVIVDPLGLRRRVEIGTGGDRNLQLFAAQPGDVTVRVIDKQTRKDLPKSSVTWHAKIPKGVSGWSPESVERDRESGTFSFQAPVGKITMSADCEGYAATFGSSYEVELGRNEFTIELERVCGVEITLRDGKATVPWDSSHEVELEEVDGDGRVQYWSGNRVAATKPGEYVLSMQRIAGYQAIPDRKVTIRPAEWTKVEIELKRR